MDLRELKPTVVKAGVVETTQVQNPQLQAAETEFKVLFCLNSAAEFISKLKLTGEDLHEAGQILRDLEWMMQELGTSS